jgi:hypothetical protein
LLEYIHILVISQVWEDWAIRHSLPGSGGCRSVKNFLKYYTMLENKKDAYSMT